MQAPFPSRQQPAGGGFFRSMAGGIVGGVLGGMLFRSLGFSGGGWGGGGGIGLFDIVLIGGILFLIYRMVRRRREQVDSDSASYRVPDNQSVWQSPPPQYAVEPDDVDAGLSHIRRMDPGFDESRFCDGVMDIFFRVQGAWMNRDLAPVAGLLTDEMQRVLRGDAERLRREGRTNRLENIAVRNVDIVEAWQESGQDFVTALIYANLLDYTTDDATGAVVDGSRTVPVKFEELWTFIRPVGDNPWRLSAIDQR
jgi:predicted lipid-binding transport protein (Tim44 family)